MINFIRGQKAKLTDLTSSTVLQVSLAIVDQANRTFDISCFGVDAQNKLSDDRYFIFYNQTAAPDGALAIVNSLPNDLVTFQLDLARLPSSIRNLVFVASLDGAGDMSQIQQGYVRLLVQGNEVGKFSFTGKDFSNERAIIVAEIYWKEVWRFAAVGQGFKGGLSQLLEHFGGQEVLPVQTNPTPVKSRPMEFKGKLVRWDDERGFGFIRLLPSRKEIFIHITALAGMPRRPVAGDTIYFQLESGDDGKTRAKSARIEGLAKTHHKQTRKNSSDYVFIFIFVLVFLTLVAVLWYAIFNGEDFTTEDSTAEDFTGYQCEGKQHCSQMTCKEARFYLKNCPDVKIDGDSDGKPCEDQCGH